MAIAFDMGARQAHRVIQRGVVELVGKHRVASPCQRLYHAQIRHIAGGKQQRGGLADEGRQLVFELLVR